MSAARTNLSSDDVQIGQYKLGEGAFRICLEGTFVGGTRNGQEAACKRFKASYRNMQDEFFAKDFQIADKVIEVADDWNSWCPRGKEILVSRGSIHHSRSGIPYLVEPVIRNYTKFTSNSGWVGDNDDWRVRCMEAFSHFSYHKMGGSLVVCDLQGRFRFNKFSKQSRFEISDPAICSRWRLYGPTDLGEKGIDSFFDNHVCNEFCQSHWARPRYTQQWFALSKGTSMLGSQYTSQLRLTSGQTFYGGLGMVAEDYEDSDSDDSSYY